MTTWELFYLLGGLSLGAIVGYILCAIMVVGRDADNEKEE